MRWHRYRHRRPPWWPQNEHWPPAARGDVWRRGRARFVRRIAVVFAALLFLSALGGAALASILWGGGGARLHIAQVAIPVIALIFLFGLLATLVRRVGSPLGDIVEAANRVAEGDFATRITEHGPPPVRVVARAFNSMAARLESQDRQRRHLLADIAHELRTPLSVVQGRLEGLLDGVYARDDARLSEVLDETRLLTRLVEDLRTLAHAESGMLALQKEPTDLAILIQDVVNSLSADAGRRQVSVEVDASADLTLALVDPLRIREVLANLLSNALHHTPAGGVVSIAAKTAYDVFELTVADTGSGIAAEELPKIFDRFYKGSTSRGSGLGLTIARNLVTAHGGTMRAESGQGQGTTITFTLPLGEANTA